MLYLKLKDRIFDVYLGIKINVARFPYDGNTKEAECSILVSDKSEITEAVSLLSGRRFRLLHINKTGKGVAFSDIFVHKD